MKRSDKYTTLLAQIVKGFEPLRKEAQKVEVEEQKRRTDRAMAGKTLSFKL